MPALAAATAALVLLTGLPSPPPPLIGGGVLPSASAQSREEAAARGSRAQSLRGALPSLYRGIYFHADQERFRLCVGHREGSFTYMVVGGGNLTGDARGDYYGTYQFSYRFQNGIPFMMASESRRTRDGLREEALALRQTPINRWSRYWQDRAFYTVLNYNGKWTGRHHWALAGSHCNTLVPAGAR
jgi:hypothetical protein